VVEYSHTTNSRGFGPRLRHAQEHTVNPTIYLELARQEHSQRLAHSHQARVRAAARHARQPSENTGRPPDPRRATARSTHLVDAATAR
jgi:hypothetical protein